MGTETEYTVEVYDAATGEHYTRPANAEELAFYEELANQVATAGDEQNAPPPNTPSDPA